MGFWEAGNIENVDKVWEQGKMLFKIYHGNRSPRLLTGDPQLFTGHNMMEQKLQNY